MKSRFVALLVLALQASAVTLVPTRIGAQELPEPVEAVNTGAPMSRAHQKWLEDVAPLMSDEEFQFFVEIREAYRRDSFIREFWEVRDPDPLTRLNELEVRWKEFVERSGFRFGRGDDRAGAYILNGEPGGWFLPDGREVSRCYAKSDALEIWFYGQSEQIYKRIPLIFLKRGLAVPYEIWQPGMSLRAVPRSGGLPTTDIRFLCAEELMPYTMAVINQMISYEQDVIAAMTPPRPPPEWLATFAANSTSLPEGVELFDVELDVAFVGRNQNRAAMQAVVGIASEVAGVQTFAERKLHNFSLIGDLVRDGALFESFRYRFELAAADEVEIVPLVFTRYLRSGPATLHLRIHDIFGAQYARVSLDLDAPSAEGFESVRPKPTSGIFRMLAEASEAAARGERLLRLVPPQQGSIHVGYRRFEARTVGDFDRVTFLLDDRPVLTKRRPPYSVELNLGNVPSTHLLRAVGYFEDSEVAMDEIRVNQGGQRFRVHITEPRSGRLYEDSVTAMVQVDTPDARPLERLEIFLNEDRLATLYQPPWVQGILLPEGEALAYVRAVAYLPDGSSTEDVQFINAPDYLEEVEVQYVELHSLVVDGNGRPILNLEQDAFRVFEDGQEQIVRRFEYIKDLPIHAGLLLDTSASMKEDLLGVTQEALTFARDAIRPEDRMSVVSFASQPKVEVPFSNDISEVERALAGLEARGSTALYDSLVFALTYFDGVKGQKALLLLSDGKDETSAFTEEQAMEVARRSGVIVYGIGLKEVFDEKAARKVLNRLSRETGGKAYFLDSLDELGAVYEEIQTELRSRYLLAYQSTSDKDENQFRNVRVEVNPRGEVRTMSGYYP
ncbi:MAG: VWA domain-containing protein [Acidobacteriota bacterium]|nr:VWA domain-containing protein [Acidobacteriota bacterium]